MQAEKKDLLEHRFSVRREAEKQKRTLMEKVERMKKKGEFNNNMLAELGLADTDDNMMSPEVHQNSVEQNDVSENDADESKPNIKIEAHGVGDIEEHQVVAESQEFTPEAPPQKMQESNSNKQFSVPAE